MSLDVLFLSFNRLAFTRASFGFLLVNTNWSLVERLYVYDDESEDGTFEFLSDAIGAVPVEHRLVTLKLGSPVRVMNRYLEDSHADRFAKVDNDVAVPPGWLDELVGVVDRDPTIDLLGMEAGRMGHPSVAGGGPGTEWEGPSGFEWGSHIGGVGLMRREAFDVPIPARGRFGFTQYQLDRQLNRGWIVPDLMVPQLDRIPTEPWTTLNADYLNAGWQRYWPTMDARWTEPYWRWVNEALGYRVPEMIEGDE